MSGASKRGFDALGAYLQAQGAAGHTRVTLAFVAIETTILRRPLPATARVARRHHAWWYAESGAYHVWYGWRSVGWQVAAVDLAAETVSFTRVAADE